MSHAERGALLGAGLGSLAGGAIGHRSGHTGAGAVLGGLAGGVTGAVVGDAADAREERDAALAYAHNQQMQALARGALTNGDVVRMANSGVGDSVIANSIRERGGRFDTSPSAIIQLKQNGVSDAVIEAMQSHTAPPVYPPPAYVPPPAPVYVTPPPAVHGHIIVGPGRRWHRHRHWCP